MVLKNQNTVPMLYELNERTNNCKQKTLTIKETNNIIGAILFYLGVSNTSEKHTEVHI